MIFKFIRKLFFGIIRKIIILILVIAVAIWFFFFKDKEVDFSLPNVNVEELGNFTMGLFDRNMEFELKSEQRQDFEVTDEMKTQINAWIKANGFNEYGDPKGTYYVGGTPLFNEKTGETIDRYDYILSNNPELRELAQ